MISIHQVCRETIKLATNHDHAITILNFRKTQPVLLLPVIDLIREGLITDSRTQWEMGRTVKNIYNDNISTLRNEAERYNYIRDHLIQLRVLIDIERVLRAVTRGP